MNKKIRLILIMGLTAIGLAFGLLYLTWGGDNESKLEKTIIKSTDENSVKSFDDLISTTWISQKEDSSSAEISFIIESSPKYTKGYFENFDILFKVSDNDPTKSKLKVSIDVSSIDTDNSMRDKNLMDEDYFNTINYPSISFISKEIKKEDTNYIAKGIIDMMGKESELSFKFNFKGTELNKNNKKVAIFDGEFQLNRVDLGMPSIKSIGDKVDVSFYCELVQKK